jgi:hypothetical protein
LTLANFYVGDTIRDYFTVLDESDVPIAGLTVTMISTLVNGETTFMGATEVGGGTYYVQFSPDVPGNYYYLLSVNSDPVQYFENNFDVDGPVETSTELALASGTTTLEELIYGVATEVGDLRVLKATEAGGSDGGSFIDRIRGSAMPSEALRGANAWVATADSGNYWQETRITSYDGNTNAFTVSPNFPSAIQENEVIWLTNIYSKGFWRQQYIDAINSSVKKFTGINAVPLNYTITGLTYGETAEIARPDALTHIYGVTMWGYDDTTPYDIPMAPQNRSDLAGWSYDYATKQIRLRSFSWVPREIETIRILGFGSEGGMTLPTDTTRASYALIVPDAAARLLRGKGDPRLLANAAQTQSMADTWFPASTTQYPPNTLSVR